MEQGGWFGVSFSNLEFPENLEAFVSRDDRTPPAAARAPGVICRKSTTDTELH
jgi:hypothetical protein